MNKNQTWEEDFTEMLFSEDKNAAGFVIDYDSKCNCYVEENKIKSFIRTQKELSHKEGYEAGYEVKCPQTYEERNMMGKQAMEDRAPLWIEQGKQEERERIISRIKKMRNDKEMAEMEGVKYAYGFAKALADLKEFIVK